MAHNRAQLNALIFHNEVVLPRTSPGFAEVTLAVAELQGGNNAKAALYAETAYRQDPTLAAAWLAKTAADVFEATPDDLRRDRALFCMDRALECVPSCRREIVEFFVANILGHYVEVLCAGAVSECAHWLDLEAEADELEEQASELGWQATQMRARATLLEAAGLVAGLVAVFSRRLGTQVFSGVTSVAAFSEAASRTRNAALLDAMGINLRAAGGALRHEGSGHRTASMLYLVPARDLIAVATKVLQAEGLPLQPLNRLTQAFSGSLRQVLGGHLQRLRHEVGTSMFNAIQGDARMLEISYWGTAKSVTGQEMAHLFPGLRPVSRGTLLWIAQMLPGVQRLAAYQLLASPLSFVAERVYGLRRVFAERALVKRIHKAHARSKPGGAGCVAVLAFGLLFVYAPVALLIGVAAIGYAIQNLLVRRRRRRAEVLLSSLWSANTWLMHLAIDLYNENPAVGVQELEGLLPLPGEEQGEKFSAKMIFADIKFILIVGVLVTLAFLGLLFLLLFGGMGHTDPSPAKEPGSPTASVAPRTTGAPAATPPEIRRATAVLTPTASTTFSAAALSATSPTPTSYAVVGVPTGDTLNVRAGPGANNSVIAKLPKGTTHVGITGASVMNGGTEWVPIKVGDRTGWVTKAHLERE